MRLLLWAEMKLSGEAWLELKIRRDQEKHIYQQTATFRPHGLKGRFYWILLLPIHHLIFKGMARAIAQK